MKISDIVTENLSDLFGKGSDIGKVYNPGKDSEVQAAAAARSGKSVTARPTGSGEQQSQWDATYGEYFNPDGTPKTGAQGSGGVSYIQGYANKTRNKPIKPALMSILKRASDETGLRVVIFSGGQDVKGRGTRRTGSTRHDAGAAADIYVYAGNKQLRTDGNDPRVVNFIAALRRAGAKGFGAHPGYMGGTGIHVDIVGTATGGSNMWGAGGTGSPPMSLARAFQTGKGTSVA
jgi:hypothetical protein